MRCNGVGSPPACGVPGALACKPFAFGVTIKQMAMLKRILLVVGVILILAGAGTAYWLFHDLPSPQVTSADLSAPSVRIVDRSGRLLYEMLPGSSARQTSVSLDRIPLFLQQATIATEDSHFYQNPGVDLGGILRAVWINLSGGETLSGGSTITQQVARTLLLSAQERGQRTLRRKLRETVLAWQLTRRYSKAEVLAYYLNYTSYGGMAYGVEAAAQTFFGKPAAELDLAESALIAGLPQSPAVYNPFTDLKAARARQSVVLGLMLKNGYIDAAQRAAAEREPLVLAGQPYPLEAPHFVMMVRAQLDALLTPEQMRSGGGLVVRTALDLDQQRLAEQAVSQQLQRLRQQEQGGRSHNVNDVALVAIDPHSGDVLAMVGSPNYFDDAHAGAINMALAPRQPGSALKPFIYAAAFDPSRPDPWTPASMILDTTAHFITHEGDAYTPANYDGLEHGPVLVRTALGSSLNIPAVKALQHIGLPSLFSELAKLGITSLGDPAEADLSLALGGGEVRLLDLTAAYGSFANGGYRVQPVVILDITDQQGELLYQAAPRQPERVLDERVCWLISDMLSDDNARAIGFGRNSMLKLDRPAAVKTGTTTNYHDNWTVGYTPDLVVGVWAGNATHEAMRDVTGLTGSGPIWHQFIRSALAGTPETPFKQPPGIVQAQVCALDGLIPGPACPNRILEWFIDGTQPVEMDRFYRQVTLDGSTGRLAGDSTPAERRVQALALDLPPEAQPWARSNGLLLWNDLVSQADAGDSPAGDTAPLCLIAPGPRTIFRLAPDLPAEAQQLKLSAAGESGITSVSLWVDGVRLDTSGAAPFQAWWPLQLGQHSAWAEGVRADGSRVETEHVQFEVRS